MRYLGIMLQCTTTPWWRSVAGQKDQSMTIKIEGFDKIVSLSKDNADAVVKSSTVAAKGFEELAKYSQSYLAKSAETANAAVKALFSVKTPAELADLQSKLARETIESAISEGRKFAELSQSVFSAAFEPLNARIAAFQALAKSAA